MSDRAPVSNTMLLGISFLVLFVGGGARFAIGLTLKPMAEELAWGRSHVGLAVAVFLVVSASCLFVSGRLSDRFSLRHVLLVGLALSALGIGSMAFVQHPWQMLVLYGGLFAIGNGVASITPIGVLVTRWFPQRTGLANAVAISGIGVGQLAMIGGFALTLDDIGWRAVFGWLGVVHLVLIPVIAMGLRDETRSDGAKAATSSGSSVRGALSTRYAWTLLAVYAVCGCQDFFVSTHVVAFAQDGGVDALLAGNLLALMGLTGLVGVVAAGLWCDLSGPVPATLACFVLRIALFSLILAAQDLAAVAVFALLYGVTFWVTAPLTVIFVRHAFGMANLGALSGLVTMVHHMAGGVGAYLAAVSFDRQGHYDTVFAIMLALSVVGVVATLALQRAPPDSAQACG